MDEDDDEAARPSKQGVLVGGTALQRRGFAFELQDAGSDEDEEAALGRRRRPLLLEHGAAAGEAPPLMLQDQAGLRRGGDFIAGFKKADEQVCRAGGREAAWLEWSCGWLVAQQQLMGGRVRMQLTLLPRYPGCPGSAGEWSPMRSEPEPRRAACAAAWRARAGRHPLVPAARRAAGLGGATRLPARRQRRRLATTHHHLPPAQERPIRRLQPSPCRAAPLSFRRRRRRRRAAPRAGAGRPAVPAAQPARGGAPARPRAQEAD